MKKQWKTLCLCSVMPFLTSNASVYNNALDYTKSYLPNSIGSITLTANSPQLAQQLQSNSAPGTWAVNQRNGTNGIINNYIGNGAVPDVVKAMLIEPNGSFVIVGSTPDTPTQSLMVRYLANGILDTSFANDGVFTFNGSQNGTASELTSIVSDSSGGYYAGGFALTATQGFVAHVTGSGTLATAFGTQGIAQFLAFKVIIRLALQSTGNLVCVGLAAARGPENTLLIARLTPTGQPDTIFTSYQQSNMTPYGVAIDNQQRIITISDNEGPRNPDILAQIYRINPNGTLDPSFNDEEPYTFNGYARGIAILSDDSIITAGSDISNANYLITKITSTGALDTNFGTSGVVLVAPKIGGTNTIANAITILPNGTIAVAGEANNGASDWFGTVLLNADGTLNQSFSIPGQLGDAGAGTAIIQIAGNSLANCIGYQQNYLNSGLVVAGVVNNDNNLGAIFYTNVGVTT